MNRIMKSLVTCAALSIAGTIGGSAQEISYLTNNPENFPKLSSLRAIVEDYAKEHPEANAKWTFMAATQATIMQQVQIHAASGTLPLFFEMPDRSTARAMYEKGLILNILPVLKRLDLEKYIKPFAKERMQIIDAQGSEVLFSIPWSISFEGFFYNKALFAKYNLAVPATWDEFLKVCDVLNKAGVQPIAVGGADSWPILRLLGMYATRRLGNDAMERVWSGKLPLTDPGFVEAARVMQELGNKGYFGPAVATLTYSQASDMFTGGKAGMIYSTASVIGIFSRPENAVKMEDIGIMGFPTVSGGKGTADAWGTAPGGPGHMSKAAYEANPKAVDAFLRYMVPIYGDRARAAGSLPGFVTTKSEKATNPLLAELEARLAEAKDGIFPFEQHFTSRAFILAGTTAGLLATGKVTPEKYIEQVAEANKR